MLSEAARGLGFEYDDVRAVRPLVRERAAKVLSRDDNLTIIRAWLSVAADLRERGEVATKPGIIAEMSRRIAKSSERTRGAAAALNDAVNEGLRAKGHEPPAEPVADVQKLREARKRRDSRDEG